MKSLFFKANRCARLSTAAGSASLLALTLGIILSSVSSSAKVKAQTHSASAQSEAVKEMPLEMAPEFMDAYTDAERKELAERIKQIASRKVAAVDALDPASVNTSQFQTIRNSLIGGDIYKSGKKVATVPGAQSSEDIDHLLTLLETNMKNGDYTEPDALMLASQLLVLKSYRGVIYRARNIFETKDGNAHLAHASAVTALRFVASGISVYLPTPQWKAGFQYITEPFYVKQDADCNKADSKGLLTWSQACDISDGSTFQTWMRREVLPSLRHLSSVLNKLNFANRPVYWDNRILYGPASFVSSNDQFVRLGEAERLAMLSGVQAAISSIYGMSAFSLDGLFKAVDDVAVNYGFESYFDAGRATSERRFATIRKHRNLFARRKQFPDVIQSYLQNSYAALKTSLENARSAWKALEGHEGDPDLQKNLLDPRAVAPFARILNAGFTNAYGFAGLQVDSSGRGSIEIGQGDVASAVVGGEKVTFHLKRFFDDPPQSLQDFMPDDFDRTATPLSKLIGKTSVPYRNYIQGRPIHWNYPVFAKYIDGVNSQQDVERVARVMSQSWGGFIFGLPLSLVLF